MQLVIVESPTKSKTIQKFLRKEYKVLSSYGHIRDLPKSELGIDIENNFEPKYIIPLKSRKIVKLLKEDSKKADLTILATDEDREGEAIAWHLAQALDLDDKKPYQRIVFHEITKSAIEKALKNPRKIDIDLVDSQQARRILDRIVGYKLSPFLWKKIARGLSAGRVQSVAVRLVVEREREIQSFIPQEYWTIEAVFKKEGGEFTALLVKIEGKIIPKLGIKNKKEVDKILKGLEDAEYKVINVEKKEVKRNPLPPFTTSTLQQEAWQRFRFPAKFTMRIAQNLYERGFITYHRTDSLNLSDLSLFGAKKFIIENFGENYWAGFLRKYKTKSKGAQEAHEAIRPTYPDNTSEKLKEKLDDNQFNLYDLIWRRFIACQMAQAIFDSTVIDISAKNPAPYRNEISGAGYIFRATGQILKFDGFLKVYPIKYEEKELPLLETNEILELIKLNSLQHFTQPPPRYTEATLIRALEENGIGRPSTYAPILSTVQERNYIEKDENRKFKPTEIGFVVNDLLVSNFPEIVDIKFTAKMEKELDEIAQNAKEWVPVIKEFYGPFSKNLEKKYEEVSKKDFTEKPTEKKCPKCGAPLLIRLGKYGQFYACSKFPKCRYTESLEKNDLNIKCPKCKKGEIVAKRTKKGKIFYGCSNYPKCDLAFWDKPTGEKCPKCNSLLVETKRKQIKCSSKECDFKK
jgi:DNA topoisomerase-1